MFRLGLALKFIIIIGTMIKVIGHTPWLRLRLGYNN